MFKYSLAQQLYKKAELIDLDKIFNQKPKFDFEPGGPIVRDKSFPHGSYVPRKKTHFGMDLEAYLKLFSDYFNKRREP